MAVDGGLRDAGIAAERPLVGACQEPFPQPPTLQWPTSATMLLSGMSRPRRTTEPAGSPPTAEAVVRLATVHLEIEKSEPMPPNAAMVGLLRKWGLASRTQEAFWVIAYDSAMNIRTVVEVTQGSYATVGVHLPGVFTAVLLAGADRFQVAHNHPDGNAQPTSKDIQVTQVIMDGANVLGLFFEDHHIVGPTGQYYSFAANKRLLAAPYTGELSNPLLPVPPENAGDARSGEASSDGLTCVGHGQPGAGKACARTFRSTAGLEAHNNWAHR
jgi:hypothetical protein